MGLYRCNHCQPPRTFEADRPVCEACGLDPKKDARHGRFIDQLLVIHYDPPTAIRGIGQNVAACNPKLRVGGQGVGPTAERFTGEKTAVTCEKCKQTAAYQGETKGAAPLSPAVGIIGSLELSKAAAGVA